MKKSDLEFIILNTDLIKEKEKNFYLKLIYKNKLTKGHLEDIIKKAQKQNDLDQKEIDNLDRKIRKEKTREFRLENIMNKVVDVVSQKEAKEVEKKISQLNKKVKDSYKEDLQALDEWDKKMEEAFKKYSEDTDEKELEALRKKLKK